MSGIMCTNCWEWVTEKMTINDIAMVVAGINFREPENRYAREICYYLVGDNYTFGKSKLAQGNYKITVEKLNHIAELEHKKEQINRCALEFKK